MEAGNIQNPPMVFTVMAMISRKKHPSDGDLSPTGRVFSDVLNTWMVRRSPPTHMFFSKFKGMSLPFLVGT